MAFALAALLAAVTVTASADDGREFYASWGYNADWYAPTDIRFLQADQGNDFVLSGVRGHDDRAMDLWNHDITIPQYSVRIGGFFGRHWGAELNYDHAKFIVARGQAVNLTGTLRGRRVDTTVRITDDLLKYKLNNGANLLFFMAVYRIPWGHGDRVATLLKAGPGFMIPHTENTVLGRPNEAGFQVMGPCFGWESAVRVRLFRGAYTEASLKGFYAQYDDVNIAGGKAGHELRGMIATVSVGYALR